MLKSPATTSRGLASQSTLEPAGQRIQPCELVGVLVAADGLAIRYIGTDHEDSTDRRSDQPFLLIGMQRVAENDIAWRLARQQGNAVVGLLPREGDVITRGLDLRLREGMVLELRFLQADDVGLLRRQPVEKLRQADLERVDVPAGNFHVALKSGNAAVPVPITGRLPLTSPGHFVGVLQHRWRPCVRPFRGRWSPADDSPSKSRSARNQWSLGEPPRSSW
jgi:hypothetical protein